MSAQYLILAGLFIIAFIIRTGYHGFAIRCTPASCCG